MAGVAPQTFRIMCVDDNSLVADALRRRLTIEPSLRWAGLVSDARSVDAMVDELAPDLVLMDVDMPEVDTFAIVQGLSGRSPGVRVVMFSGHVEIGYIDRALDCGAWGYLSKNEDVSSLIECIHRVMSGEVVLSAEAEAVYRRSRSVDDPGGGPAA